MNGAPFAWLWLAEGHLFSEERPGARRFGVDARCLAGVAIADAHVHLCALEDPAARIPFDQPEVQQVRRDAYAWWIPMLGDDLICLSTLSLDAVHYGGAITVARSPRRFGDDPFARLFPGRALRSDIFCAVDPPPGPVLERYAGAPWPGGRFPAADGTDR